MGTRPHFIKTFPIVKNYINSDFQKSFDLHLVNTGQHYSKHLSEIFFDEFGLLSLILNLNNGQTEKVSGSKMIGLCQMFFRKQKCDLGVVIGDTNTTLAGAIGLKSNNIPLVHIESGLRSGDLSMPEELNRIITDAISDHHFITMPSAKAHLIEEGIKESSIIHTGNLLVDAIILNKSSPKIRTPRYPYGMITLHRHQHMADIEKLRKVIQQLDIIAAEHRLILPLHPRLSSIMRYHDILVENIKLVNAMNHSTFIHHLRMADFVITDSGGVSEEASFLGIPCFTLRLNTERPETLENGNVLVGLDFQEIKRKIGRIKVAQPTKKNLPEGWDGHAAVRILNAFKKILRT